jgi:hypothetical protein
VASLEYEFGCKFIRNPVNAEPCIVSNNFKGDIIAAKNAISVLVLNKYSTSGLSNAAPVIYFPGALIYSAGFNVKPNFKKKYF